MARLVSARVAGGAGVLLLLAVIHVGQRSGAGIVSLMQHCCDGTGPPAWTLPGAGLPEGEAEEGDLGGEEGGWRWIKQGANLNTPKYYDHPLSTIGQIDPYTDLPRATVRGLPNLDRDYDVSRLAPPLQVPGMKTVFSTNRATSDLAAMKEFGLVSKHDYERKRRQIDTASLDPFVHSEGLPRPGQPEGWTGPTKMCRDIRTESSAGLGARGYAALHTLRCCSFLCGKTQWQALRAGELKWGYGIDNRFTKAVDTGAAGLMADGSHKWLCRSCAWYKEPDWDELGMDGLPKMEGHIGEGGNSTNSTRR